MRMTLDWPCCGNTTSGWRPIALAGDVDAYFWHNVEFRHAEAEVGGNQELVRNAWFAGAGDVAAAPRQPVPSGSAGPVGGPTMSDCWTPTPIGTRPLAVALTRAIIMAGLRAIENSGWSGLRSELPGGLDRAVTA